MNWYFSNQDPVDGACACQVRVQSRAQAHVRPFPSTSLRPRLPSSWGRCYCCIHYSWSRTPGSRLSTTTVQKPVEVSCFFCTLLANVFITLPKFKDLSVCLETLPAVQCCPVSVITHKKKSLLAKCSRVECKHKIHIKADYGSSLILNHSRFKI